MKTIENSSLKIILDMVFVDKISLLSKTIIYIEICSDRYICIVTGYITQITTWHYK